MHSDDTHKKEGFFSKIFGHHDGAQVQSDDANVIQPQDAASVGVADTPLDSAPSLDPIDFASKNTDASQVSAGGSDDTLQLHEVSADTPSGDSKDVLDGSKHDSESGTMSGASLSGSVDELKGSVSDVLAVPKDDTAPLDLSQHAVASIDGLQTEAPVADASATAEQVDSQNQPDASSSEVDTADTDESVGSVESKDADGQIDSSSHDTVGVETGAQPMSDSSTQQELASSADSVTSDSTKTDAVVDIEPPMPPVDEGKAWQAAQSEVSSQAEVAPASDVSVAGEEGRAALSTAQDQVDQIFATHPDFTTGHEADKAEDDKSDATPNATATASENATTEVSATHDSPEVQAAVARLEQHIDDLETGLQKVRTELAALKK